MMFSARTLRPASFLLAGLAVVAWRPTSSPAADEKPPAAEAPAAPTPVDATDKAALEANLGKVVAVTGVVAKAEWSKSGKVMNVEFKDSVLLVAAFEKSKEPLNAAFGGDAAKAWAAAGKVTITGKLAPYGGKAKDLEGRPQIVVSDAKQVVVAEATPAADEKK
jgi:hypothetical protein